MDNYTFGHSQAALTLVKIINEISDVSKRKKVNKIVTTIYVNFCSIINLAYEDMQNANTDGKSWNKVYVAEMINVCFEDSLKRVKNAKVDDKIKSFLSNIIVGKYRDFNEYYVAKRLLCRKIIRLNKGNKSL